MKLWSLQILRFWAALAVVHLHAVQRSFELSRDWGTLGPAAGVFGRAGVDVFFVLSGLIITLTAKGLTPREFAWKRARRIWPLYLLIAIPMAIGTATDWRTWLATLTLWPATDVMTAPALAVGWTLCFEALFYAAAALVIWNRRAIWGLLAVFALALALRDTPLTQFVGNPIIFEFLAGVLIAFAPRTRLALLGLPVGLGLLVAGAVLGWPPMGKTLGFLAGDEAWVRLLTLGIPAAMIVWGALQINAREGVLSRLGDASYALYLIHAPAVVAIVLVLSPHLPADLCIAAALLASVVLSWRVHEIIEKPILAFLSRRRVAPVAA